MAKKRKVLMITYQFPPARSNEVRRVQKIAKVLIRNSISVDVIASANPGIPMDDKWRLNDINSDLLSIHRIRSKTFSCRGKIKKMFCELFRLHWQFAYAWQVFKYLRTIRRKLSDYDYIYCTIRPYSLLFLPILIKKMEKEAKVLIDFRFLFYLESYYYKKLGKFNYIYYFFDKWLLRKNLIIADYRVALTEGLANRLKQVANVDFQIIEQGYDSEERNVYISDCHKINYYCKGMINVVYAGSITSTQADPAEMSILVHKMLEKHRNLVFHFFGLVDGLKKRLDGHQRVKFYGYLNYESFIYVIRKADIVWMYYTNNGKNDFRIGTKTYDYMNYSKPILCFCSPTQLTIKTLNNYPCKYIITNDYIGSIKKIDFEKLMRRINVDSVEYDIYILYRDFLNI